MSNHTNIVRIKAVANILNQLNEEFVFVGGATVSLYGDVSKGEARPTEDVDVIIELASYTGYAELDENLRKLGFENDIESGVLCRYKVKGVIVDVMPTDASVIGFTNRWYADGFKFGYSSDYHHSFSSTFNSTTRRPPPSSGIRITKLRASLVTSMGPSPVRGFMAAMLVSFYLSTA